MLHALSGKVERAENGESTVRTTNPMPTLSCSPHSLFSALTPPPQVLEQSCSPGPDAACHGPHGPADSGSSGEEEADEVCWFSSLSVGP